MPCYLATILLCASMDHNDTSTAATASNASGNNEYDNLRVQHNKVAQFIRYSTVYSKWCPVAGSEYVANPTSAALNTR